MKSIFLVYLIVPTLLLFSGCTRYFNWAIESVPQGTASSLPLTAAPGTIASAYIYDQFTTLGLFEVLFLDRGIRQHYAALYAYKYQLTPELAREFCRRQFHELNQHISFYILVGGWAADTMSKDAPNWSIRLIINNIPYAPVHLSSVELPLEYRSLFGRRFSRFKVPYIVKFDAHDEHGKPLLTESTKVLKLVLRCVSKEVTLEWSIDALQRNTARQKKEFQKMLVYDVWPDPL